MTSTAKVATSGEHGVVRAAGDRVGARRTERERKTSRVATESLPKELKTRVIEYIDLVIRKEEKETSSACKGLAFCLTGIAILSVIAICVKISPVMVCIMSLGIPCLLLGAAIYGKDIEFDKIAQLKSFRDGLRHNSEIMEEIFNKYKDVYFDVPNNPYAYKIYDKSRKDPVHCECVAYNEVLNCAKSYDRS